MSPLPRPNDIVDPQQAEDAADDARARPEVRRFISRINRLLKDMPDDGLEVFISRLKCLLKDMPNGLEVFVGESVAVLAQGPHGEPFMTDTGEADTAAIIESFNDPRWDRGGW